MALIFTELFFLNSSVKSVVTLFSGYSFLSVFDEISLHINTTLSSHYLKQESRTAVFRLHVRLSRCFGFNAV